MSIPNSYILDDDELVPCAQLVVGDVVVAMSTADPASEAYHFTHNAGKVLPYRMNTFKDRRVVKTVSSTLGYYEYYDVAHGITRPLGPDHQYWRRGTDYGYPTNQADPKELLVEGKDLQQGDAVLARWTGAPEYVYKDKIGRGNLYGQVMIVQSVGDVVAVTCWSRHVKCIESHALAVGDKYWIRPRRVATQSNRFPHKCSFCGQAAYVGFTRIEHATPGQCSAR